MRTEHLREACEAAGLERSVPAEGFDVWWLPLESSGGERRQEYLPPLSPALPAYVAELLVERVWRERRLDWAAESGHSDVCQVDFSPHPVSRGTSIILCGRRSQVTDCTIAAALVVLGHWTEEQAREVLRDERMAQSLDDV